MTKKFNSFDLEEQWLQQMAQDGWRLISYDSENLESCTYKFEQHPAAHTYHYQIDYRTFINKAEYEEYTVLFEEAGWTILSKNYTYNKHIFASTTKKTIFSDQVTSLQREINRYKTAKLYVALAVSYTIVALFIYYYFQFDMSWYGGILMPGFIGIVYSIADAYKRKKTLKLQTK